MLLNGAVLAIIIIFILIIASAVGVAIYLIRKTDPSRVDASQTAKANNTKDFILFKSIEDNAVDLGLHQYRAYIECSSINFGLKLDEEKEQIEASYQRLLNSLTHPIATHIQTRVIDMSKIVEHLGDNIAENTRMFPQMQEYGEMYYNAISNLPQYLGSPYQKKKYIIVEYGEAGEMNELSEAEKKEYSLSELHQRAVNIRNNAQALGINATILDRKKIAELLYCSYHRRGFKIIDDIMNGNLSNLVVCGQSIEADMSVNDTLQLILTECKNRLNSSVNSMSMTEEEILLYQSIYNAVETMQNASTKKDIYEQINNGLYADILPEENREQDTSENVIEDIEDNDTLSRLLDDDELFEGLNIKQSDESKTSDTEITESNVEDNKDINKDIYDDDLI